MNKGILVVVSGFSGAGKGTVMKRLMEKYDDCLNMPGMWKIITVPHALM